MNDHMIHELIEFLIKKINPAFIILFGSQAKNKAHKESDLDLAFYKPEPTISAYDTFMIAQELADKIKIEVDLIDLAQASTVFKAQIFATGKILYSSDPNLLIAYRMTALSMYARLNEERKEILTQIEESGSIYGI